MCTPSSRSRSSQKRKQQHRRRLSSTRAGGFSVCARCVFFDAKNSDARRLIRPWNRPELRRLIRQIDHRPLDKMSVPAFRRIIASDDRMCAGRVMPGRMPARRLIATADMAAGSTHTQMKPFRTGLDALLATARARCDLLNRGEVTAVSAHPPPPFFWLRIEWMAATVRAPSPTADATRVVEPARTSPIANTPGTVAAAVLARSRTTNRDSARHRCAQNRAHQARSNNSSASRYSDRRRGTETDDVAGRSIRGRCHDCENSRLAGCCRHRCSVRSPRCADAP